VLGDPQTFLVTAGDIRILPRILDAARRPEPRPAPEKMEELLRERGMEKIFRDTEPV
jgi:hypothetical protein